jgi:cytochrome c oxidase assembly protein subunit 11
MKPTVSHRNLVLKLCAMTFGMFLFGFALVPMYDIFCDVTGFGGRTAEAPEVVERAVDIDRTVRVEFVTALGQTAPWDFAPVQGSMQVHPGELYEAHFTARNLTGQHLVAQAVPSVSPGVAAEHFKKIECFCFTQQEFEANENRDLKLLFSVEPDLPEYVDTLTLSYTLFAVAK